MPTTKLKIKTYGDRYFSIVGPNIWNQLPSHIVRRHIFSKMHLTYSFYSSGVLLLYLLYSYHDYACYVSHLYFTVYTFYFHVHVYCNSGHIIILYCFTLALMYPFMHLCTLYFMYSTTEHCGLAFYKSTNHYYHTYLLCWHHAQFATRRWIII